MVRSAVAQRHAQVIDVLAADVGQRIRKARHERGMTLAQVGGDDLSRSFLSSVESGRSRISLRALAIVAQRLALPLSYFLQDAASSDERAAALALSQAEAELERGRPQESLRLLNGTAIPAGGEAKSSYLRGRAHLLLGQYREALAALREGLPLLEKVPDTHFVTDFRYYLGLALYRAGSPDEALVHLRQALDSAEADGDPILLGTIDVLIGHIHYAREDTGNAIDQYQRALDRFGAVRDIAGQGDVYAGLSGSYARNGDVDTARRYADLSAGAFKVSNGLRHMAAEIGDIAGRYLVLGDIDQADRHARESAERARQVGAREVEALAHSTLAAVYLQRGDLDGAEVEAQLAQTLADENAGPGQIAAWETLARIAEQREDLESADRLYSQALEALRAAPYQPLYGTVALAYGELLRRRGETERALDLAFEVARAQLGQRS